MMYLPSMLTRSLPSLINSRLIARTFASSGVAYKGKRRSLTARVLDEDDFAFDGSLKEDEELFGSSTPETTVVDLTQDSTHRNMRAELFNALHVSSLAILNLRGQMSQPPKKSTVTRLTALAENEEDLRKVLDVVAAFRNVSRPPDLKTCDDFLGRCITLNCPKVALEALQNRSKYGIDISSLATARRLLHALSRPASNITQENLSDTLQFAELYTYYGMPPASTDLISCATIASALFRFTVESSEKERPEVTLINIGAIDLARKDILSSLRQISRKRLDQADTIGPKTLHRLKGRVSEIRKAIRNSEKRSVLWLKRLESKITRESNVVVASA